jgi:hypothetical protein
MQLTKTFDFDISTFEGFNTHNFAQILKSTNTNQFFEDLMSVCILILIDVNGGNIKT